MLLGGLWHGASWNFVIWGGLHGAYLAIHKWRLKDRKVLDFSFDFKGWQNNFRFFLQTGLTFILVSFTWLFFRSTSWESTIMFFEGIIYWESSSFTWDYIRIVAVFFTVSFVIDLLEYRSQHHSFMIQWNLPALRYGILSALFITTLIYLFQAPPSPFIYFQFWWRWS